MLSKTPVFMWDYTLTISKKSTGEVLEINHARGVYAEDIDTLEREAAMFAVDDYGFDTEVALTNVILDREV